MIENRLFVRFPVSGSILIQPDLHGSRVVECELFDLSYDGIGLYSPEQFEKDAMVKFVVNNRQLNINLGGLGRIVFCSPAAKSSKDAFRAGIEFVRVDRQLVREILAHVRETLHKD